MSRRTLDDAISRVVRAGNCSGCGMCAALDPGIAMRLDPAGYLRPNRVSGGGLPGDSAAVASFDAVCPGRRVVAQRPRGATWDATMGPVRTVHAAWAADPEMRHRGGSGQQCHGQLD